MTTATVSRAHNVQSHLTHIAPKVAPKAAAPEAVQKTQTDHTRLSHEADSLAKQGDSKDSKDSKEAKAPEKTSVDERIAALEKELEELKKEFQDKKTEAAKPAEGKKSKASGGSSDKGPTVMNPDAPAGFLWKPESDSDGKLAILLPPNMTGKVKSVEVLSPDGQVLASGRGAGVGNGDREHFRFSQPGGSFPANSKVKITMKDGNVQEITIPQTGVRNEGGKK